MLEQHLEPETYFLDNTWRHVVLAPPNLLGQWILQKNESDIETNSDLVQSIELIPH